jgi:superfamily II DNA/RNA helicase
VPLAATTVEAAGDEELIYTELAGLRSAQQKSGVAENGKDAIIRWGLYKRFLSSPEACLSTVERRLATLDRKACQGAEVPRLNRLREALSGMSINCSSRYRLLVRELRAMGWNGRPDSPRVLLFTESRVSQTALAQALAKEFRLKYSARHEDQANQVIAAIHGTMPDVSLTKSVESFDTGSSPIRLLIATDVASEGVNLHHQCWNIIHHDLPWSIITLIQPKGRIDRFGQRHAPIIRYLMVHTNNEKLRGDEEIFSRLVTKVEEINRSRIAVSRCVARSAPAAAPAMDPGPSRINAFQSMDRLRACA